MQLVKCVSLVSVFVMYKLLSHFANKAESLPVRQVEAEAFLQVKTGYFSFEACHASCEMSHEV